MTLQRITVRPLFSDAELKVLCAVLFGLKGKDRECRSFPFTSLARVLFPNEKESVSVPQVKNALSDSVVDRLIKALGKDVILLPTDKDREFVRLVREWYPAEAEQFCDAIYDFRVGKGLPPYKPVQFPRHEPKPKPEVRRGRPPIERKPAVAAPGRRSWNRSRPASQKAVESNAPKSSGSFGNIGVGKEKLAKQASLIVSPRVMAPSSIFHYVNIVRGDDEGCGPDFHGWVVDLAIESIVTVHCDKCPLTGDMLADDVENALQKWAQLQAAMAIRDKAA